MRKIWTPHHQFWWHATYDDVTAAATPRLEDPVKDRAARPLVSLWGPIGFDEAKKCGAMMPASSVLIAPDVPSSIIAAIRYSIPDEGRPLPEDTVQTLKDRLGQSPFLDEINVLVKNGNGRGGTIRLNKTAYPQPRRVTWSVVAPNGELFAYTQHGRKPEDSLVAHAGVGRKARL